MDDLHVLMSSQVYLNLDHHIDIDESKKVSDRQIMSKLCVQGVEF